MKNIISLLLFTSLGLATISVNAKLYTPDFERNFFNQIKRHNLVVVHFNPYPEDEENEPGLDRMKDGFFALSRRDRYKDADVGFIGVNLEKLPELAIDYDIEVPKVEGSQENKKTVSDEGANEEKPVIKPSQQATLMLFKDGKPFRVGDKIVKRTGFMTRTEMEDFIEANFGRFIDKILNEKKESDRQREQVRVVQPVTRTVYRYPVRTYYSDYYDGYYGRPWRYGYGPRFGIGFGFGGRRGFGRGFGGFGFGW
jgi:hypothetical protein